MLEGALRGGSAVGVLREATRCQSASIHRSSVVTARGGHGEGAPHAVGSDVRGWRAGSDSAG
jgi:hypothetical protein